MPPRAKVGIAINLEALRAYMVEYIAEREQAGDLIRSLTLSEFLLWLQAKEKHVKEIPSRITSIKTYQHTH